MNSSDPRPDQFCFEILNGPQAGDQISLSDRSIFIGRSDEADVTIDDETASRKHAEIVFRGGTHTIIDNSTNGTLVNDQPVTEHGLQIDDEVLLGDTKLKYVALESEQAALTAPAGPATEQQGVSPMLIVVAVCAVAFVAFAFLYNRDDGGKPSQKQKDSAAAETAKDDQQPEAEPEAAGDVDPAAAVEGAERMLADARLQPHFIPQTLLTLAAAKASLAKAPAATDRGQLAEQIADLSKRATELQGESVKTFERQARLFASRGDVANARRAFEMVKAVLGDPRAPEYARAEAALQTLPKPEKR